MKRSSIIISVCLLLLLAVVALLSVKEIQKSLYPREYEELVQKYCSEYDVPEPLVYAVIRTESDFDPNAKSRVGAIGLMQLMPDTLDWISRVLGEPPEGDIAEPSVNLKYGIYYLRHLYDRFDNWDTALAAYNAGHGRVGNWLKDSRYSDDGIKLKNIPIEETRNYVNKVNKDCEQYKKLYYEGEN